MKRLALIVSIVALPAAAMAPRGISLLEVLRAAVQRVKADPSIVTVPTAGVRCVPFAAGDSATGKVTTRVSGVYCDPPGAGPSAPCAIEVQAPLSPLDPTSVPALPGVIDVPDPDAVDVQARASALFPACQVAIATLDKAQSAGLFRCACWDGVNACTYTDPATGARPCPLGVTMSIGTWAGAGAVDKACVTRALGFDESWPASCPAQ